ncbi:aminotransferase class IV [Candidatus Micrarchaeota archaeon]|nr:aminotransferase class IV [Candidatus Micrarchaeota archaeon]
MGELDTSSVEALYSEMLAGMRDGSLPNFSSTLVLVGIDRVRLARSNPVPTQSASIDYGLGLFEGESVLRVVGSDGESAVFFHPAVNVARLLWGARTKGFKHPEHSLEAVIGARMQLLALNNWILCEDGKTVKVNFASAGGKTDRVYVRSRLADMTNGVGLGNPVQFELGTSMMKVGLYLGEQAEKEGAALFLPVELTREGASLSTKSFANYDASKMARQQMRLHNEAVHAKIRKLNDEMKTVGLSAPDQFRADGIRCEVSRLEKLVCEDALLPQPDGRISEGTGENLFAVVRHGGSDVLVTPNVVEGKCLPGVTRSITLELARAEGIEMAEAMFSLPDSALEAVKLFTRSTGRGGLPIDLAGENVLGAFMTGNYAGLVCFTRVIVPKFHFDADGNKVFEGDGEVLKVGTEGTRSHVFTRLKELYKDVQAGRKMPWLNEDVRDWLTPQEIKELNEKGRQVIHMHAEQDVRMANDLKARGVEGVRASSVLELSIGLKAKPRDAQAFLRRVQMQREAVSAPFQRVGMGGFARR